MYLIKTDMYIPGNCFLRKLIKLWMINTTFITHVQHRCYNIVSQSDFFFFLHLILNIETINLCVLHNGPVWKIPSLQGRKNYKLTLDHKDGKSRWNKVQGFLITEQSYLN